MQEKMMKSRYWIYLGVLASVFLVVLMSFGYADNAFASSDKSTTTINKISVIELVNNEREKLGLQKLQEDKLLDIVAQNKLQSMINEEYFAHTSPEGTDPWKWFAESGYNFAYAGENLAIDYTDVNKQHKAWMNSPKHKKNILDDRFTHTGVAVGQTQIDGEDAIITVQVFAKPQEVSIDSSNFTPDTFNVPSELFHKGISKEIPVLDVSISNIYDANREIVQKKSNVKIFAWIAIGIITLLVVIAEYRFFRRRK